MSDKPVYLPVPVATAAQIGAKFAKQIVIIASWDRPTGKLHITTWGENTWDKAVAAGGGDLCCKALGGNLEARKVFEDYRLIDAGKRQRALELCKQACVASAHLIRSLLAVRNGATDVLLTEVLKACEESIAIAEALKPEGAPGS